jgi:hypothetical protein
MDVTHKYRIRATSTTVRSGLAVADGIEPSIAFSAPPEFKGQAGHWTPGTFLRRGRGKLLRQHFFRDGI